MSPLRPSFFDASSSDPENNIFSSPLSPDARSRSSTLAMPDLRPLKFATIMNSLDASGQLCQYEIPGGGVCRDEGCTNVHISRVLAEADGDGFDMSGA